jgi:pyruvyltransferase
MPEIVHWNPRRRLGAGVILRQLPRRSRVNNFGDLLGPWITARVHVVLGLGRPLSDKQRLLTVGSIMHFARNGDVVWGSGVNGKVLSPGGFPKLDIRAVRGPLSAKALCQSGNAVPEVYGDPALLIPHLWSDAELGIERRSGGTVVVPNFHDLAGAPRGALDPRGDLVELVRRLASAERVIGSSLHAIIVAEAYGVPAVLVTSSTEPTFKYEDYHRGTGRDCPPPVPDWRAALAAPTPDPIERWDPQPLLGAFPADLWERS